jgi:TRAP-type C4-dicarboxylate transport system substrate-binding protein
MKNLKIKVLTVLLMTVFFIGGSAHLYSLTIKIGSIAPERSPWGKALRELGQEWVKITGGKVRLKIYPGGIAGSENDVIRKMRLGVLGGGVFTNRGFIHIYPDVYALNVPFMISTEEELDYLLSKMKNKLEKAVEAKGYKVVIFTMAGWLHFYTKKPVKYPQDLKKHKLAYVTGEPKMEQAWKKSGYHIVPIEMKDMMMGLQSGMVDCFYLPPVFAAAAQYFALTPYMLSQRIAPLVGGIIFPKRVWDRIPDQFKKPMTDAAVKLSKELYVKILKLEKEAVDTMKEHGLKLVEMPPDALQKWREASAKGMDRVVGKAFSKEIYEEMLQHLRDFRAQQAKKQ